MPPLHTPRPDHAPAQNPLGRREILRRTLGLSAGAAALALFGCSTTPSRRSSVGDPIPDSPEYHRIPSQPRPRSMPPRTMPEPTARVTVISRETWASYGPNTRLANPMDRVQSITVHHDGMSPFHSTLFDDAAHRLESIRRAHVGSQRWADIGYHYAVDPAGRVWAARPEYLQGAHVRDHNVRNLGIVVLGNFEQQHPTAATLDALDGFVAMKMHEFRVPFDRVYTHRELASTACPGRHLQSHMHAARDAGGSIRTALARINSPDSVIV